MTELHGFDLLREQVIPEINSQARLYRHKRTGAELLSIENDDTNKVFGITFRTPPQDSTGLPHIMEHSVLCGSRKYPVKEPFVELLKGSLNTFLNAMTYPDKTCYPVASQNLQDFYNLIDVYLDAVFYPLISPYTLKQEGWHYKQLDPEGALSYKGVVFNEMKGAYSSPDDLLAEKCQHSLFPDNTYGLDSGGDPRVIPDLTYEQFKAFHQTYYHPSNARIFFYGDDPAAERLRILDEWLKDFDQIPVNSQVALQASFPSPRQITIPYSTGENAEAARHYLTVNWLLPENNDPEINLALSILAHILIGTPAAPLRKALIDSGLGEDLTGRGLATELRQMYFSTGLKGVRAQETQKVEKLILDTLQELARTGIDPETTAASLNTVEFRLRENNTGAFPRGLSLMLRALNTWLHGGNPISSLAFEAPLASIKTKTASGSHYFENLIQSYLVDNPHRVTLTLEPDPNLAQQMEAAETARLAAEQAKMTPNDVQAVVSDMHELQRRQETPDSPDALATIPMLKLADLDPQIKTIPGEFVTIAGTTTYYHDLFTNGIVYLNLGFDLHTLPAAWLPYLPLFGQALVEMGTSRQDTVRLSQRIGRETGGIRADWFTSNMHGKANSAAYFFLHAKAITSQTGELLNILTDLLLDARLDNPERFKQILLEAKANVEAQLIPAGHRMVNRRLRARHTEADWASEQMGGIDYLFFLRQLIEKVDTNWTSVLDTLEGIRSRLVNRQAMIVNATLDQNSWQQVQPNLHAFLDRLPDGSHKHIHWQRTTYAAQEGLVIPAQVNYVGKSLDLYRHGYDFHGSALVIAPYLRGTWLWDKVRVQGGAYGGMCSFDHLSGIFTFLSYRDPNLEKTIAIYDQSSAFLSQIDLNEQELTKSIIGAIGDLDAYQLPDAQGFTALVRHLTGINDPMRQAIRDEVLSTTAEHFRQFGDALGAAQADGEIAILGAQDGLASSELTLDIKKVL